MTDKILHAIITFHNSGFVNVGAHYVFYSTLIVNALAATERVFSVFETKISTWFPNSPIPVKLMKAEYWLEFLTDLIEALGQLNFKDGIRPRRFNKRSGDEKPSTETQQTSIVDSQQNSSAAGKKGEANEK